jgi:tetratricopeptide (TPR) repeat protein
MGGTRLTDVSLHEQHETIITETQSESQLAAHYLELTAALAAHTAPPLPGQVLDCLVTRDRIAYQLRQTGPAEPAVAQLIHQGDAQLRKLAGPIGRLSELKDWRQSFSPAPDAWWWNFAPPPGFFERFDWLWTALALAMLTVSISLALNISSRFFTGGPDTWGALAIVGQSVLTLLTTTSVLTSAGRDAAKRILSSLKFLDPFRQEAGCVAALGLLIALLLFDRSLPQIARWYNDRGYANYQAGQLTSAQRDYERAVKLDPDLLEAHYNLGLLYEDLDELDQARAEYRIALQGGLDAAYNNLARLYLLDKEYDKAIPLIFNGLKLSQDDEVRYDLHKNLGWARLGQARYDEALAALDQAVELAGDRAPAHCLRAQVLEAIGDDPQAVDQAWETCLRYADSSRPDEDIWIGLARRHFEDQPGQPGGK